MSSQAAAIGWSNRKGTFNRSEKRLALFAEGDAALSFDLLLLPSEERTVAVSLDPDAIELLFVHANARATIARGEPAGGEVKQLEITNYTPGLGDITIDFGGGLGSSSAIANGADAAAVQAACEAAPGIGAGNVACTGGPLSTTPVVMTFDPSLGDMPAGSLTQLLPDPALAVLTTISDGGGGGGLADETALEPTWPLVWSPSSYSPCPFTAAITQLTFNNLSATRRTRVRFRAILGALA